MKALIRATLWILLFVFFAVSPSISFPHLADSVPTSKFVFFCLSEAVIVALLALHLGGTAHTAPAKFTILDLLLLLLLVYITLNRYIFNPGAGFSLQFYELIALALLYIILRNIDRRIYPFLLLGTIVSGIIQVIHGIRQLHWNADTYNANFNLTGNFSNPGPFAGLLALTFINACGVYVYRRRLLAFIANSYGYKKKARYVSALLLKYVSMMGMLAILTILPATFSRAAIIAVLFAVFALYNERYGLLRQVAKRMNTFRERVFYTALLSILVVGLTIVFYSLKKESADGRLLIWKVSARIFSDNLWTGCGIDRFKGLYMGYQASYFQNDGFSSNESNLADNVTYAFNDFLQFAVEHGIAGSMLLGSILYVCFFAQFSCNENHLQWIARAGLLCTMVFAFFSYPAQILPIKVIAVLVISIISSFMPQIRSVVFVTRFVKSPFTRRLFPAFLLVAGTVVLYSTKKLHNSYTQYQHAYECSQEGRFEKAVTAYQKCYTFFKDDGPFLRHYGNALLNAHDTATALIIFKDAKNYANNSMIQTSLGDCLKASGDYDEAEQAYITASNMVPSRFYPKYQLARMYDDRGQNEKAVKLATELINKKPKMNSPAVRTIKREMSDIIKKRSI